jgi:hypothetical protein
MSQKFISRIGTTATSVGAGVLEQAASSKNSRNTDWRMNYPLPGDKRSTIYRTIR